MQGNRLEFTADGSHSVRSGQFNVLYHSMHGAIQESNHVFLRSGLDLLINKNESFQILEMGFGTGLNLLLTIIDTENSKNKITYHTVEAFPLEMDKVKALNYIQLLERNDLKETFIGIHKSEWNKAHVLNEHFEYQKILGQIEKVKLPGKYDLVYYDAFAPTTQEELWTPEIFIHLSQFLNPGAILVSYCAKGSFKRALLAAGFSIEKIPGPPGKREMIRGTFIGNQIK